MKRALEVLSATSRSPSRMPAASAGRAGIGMRENPGRGGGSACDRVSGQVPPAKTRRRFVGGRVRAPADAPSLEPSVGESPRDVSTDDAGRAQDDREPLLASSVRPGGGHGLRFIHGLLAPESTIGPALPLSSPWRVLLRSWNRRGRIPRLPRACGSASGCWSCPSCGDANVARFATGAPRDDAPRDGPPVTSSDPPMLSGAWMVDRIRGGNRVHRHGTRRRLARVSRAGPLVRRSSQCAFPA